MAFRVLLVALLGSWLVVSAAAQTEQVDNPGSEGDASQALQSTQQVSDPCGPATPTQSGFLNLDLTVDAQSLAQEPDAQLVPDLTVDAQSLAQDPQTEPAPAEAPLAQAGAEAPLPEGLSNDDVPPSTGQEPPASIGCVEPSGEVATPTPNPTMTLLAITPPPIYTVTLVPENTETPTPTVTEIVGSATGSRGVGAPTSTPRLTVTPSVTATRTGQPTATPAQFNNSAPPISFSGSGSNGLSGGPSSGGAATPTPAVEGPAAPQSGTWSGTTSQGRPITIAIDGTSVRSVNFGWSSSGCASTAGQVDNSYSPGQVTVTSTGFMALPSLPSGTSGLVILTGDFSSSTAMNGRINVTIFGSGAIDTSSALPQSCGSAAMITFNAHP